MLSFFVCSSKNYPQPTMHRRRSNLLCEVPLQDGSLNPLLARRSLPPSSANPDNGYEEGIITSLALSCSVSEDDTFCTGSCL